MNNKISKRPIKQFLLSHVLVNLTGQQRWLLICGVSLACGFVVLTIPVPLGFGKIITFLSMLPIAVGGLAFGLWGGVGMAVLFSLINLLRLVLLNDYGALYEDAFGNIASLFFFGIMVGYMSQLFHELHTEQVRKSWAEERYRQAVEHSPTPIFSIERNGSIVSWNAASERYFGYDRAIIGQNMQRIVWDIEGFKRILPKTELVFQEGRSFTDVEINFCARDGRKLIMRSRLYPVADMEGQVVECMLSNTDITDIRNLETIEHTHLTNITLLNEIARLAVSAEDMQSMLDGFAECTAKMLDAAGVLLVVVNSAPDSVGKQLYRVAYFGSFEGVDKVGAGQSGSPELTLVLPVITDALFARADSLGEGEIVSLDQSLTLPLMKAGLSPDQFGSMALRAGGEDDRELLGFGLIHFKRRTAFLQAISDYQSIAEQVSRQIALGIVKLEALLMEQERTRQLSKANAMITALSHIAAQVEITSETERIMDVLGQELKKLKVHSLLTLLNPEQTQCTIRLVSLPDTLSHQLEGIDGSTPSTDFTFPIERTPVFQQVLITRRPVVNIYRGEGDLLWLGNIPDQLAGLTHMFLSTGLNHHYIVLPLLAEESVMGILCLWGEDLQESDVPTAILFASQVASAMRKARQFREVQQMAITDELTRVYNRRQAMLVAERFFSDALCLATPFCLMVIDVDHFKLVNDRFGHWIGDQVLREMAARWRSVLRANDVIGRYGGEEFLVLLQTGDVEHAMQISERLRLKVAGIPVLAELGDSTAEVSVTVSIGLTRFNSNDERLDGVIMRADRALYLAKQAGRNCTRMC